MARQLATVQTITALSPIEGADRIELAQVLGWQVVVKKGEFKVGDKVIYAEIDSLLPERPEFEFMRERKFRVRTIKLKQQVSQGICFPMSILDGRVKPDKYFYEGDDVTEILDIKKYDPQAEQEQKETERLATIHNTRMGKFLKRYSWYRRLFLRKKDSRVPMPAFISKTDEDRIQLFPNACADWAGVEFDATEKLDGQSATYFLIPNPRRGLFGRRWIFGVCSRNFQLMSPDSSSYWTIARELNMEKKLKTWAEAHHCGIIVQGEIIGPKIQGNKYKRDKYEFYVFNVIEVDGGRKAKLNSGHQRYFCSELCLDPVPHIGKVFLGKTIPDTVKMATGYSVLAVDSVEREGIVMRSYQYNLSLKVINPDFLLKYSA